MILKGVFFKMKKYTAPELEIMEFELEDVLTLSVGDDSSGWY